MDKEQQLLEILSEWGIPFERAEHPAAFTMEDMLAYGLDKKGLIAKNLFLRNHKGDRHFLLVVAGDKQVDLKTLGGQLGQRFSFASEQRLEQQLGLQKGAVTPLGILFNTDHRVEMLLDGDLGGQPRIGVHPAANTATLFLSCDDLLRFIRRCGNPLSMVEIAP